MKKFICLLIASLVIVNFLFADPVETGLASKVAKNFYLQSINNKGLSEVNLSLAYTEKSLSVSLLKNTGAQDLPVFFIFNVNENDGFVIVSADNDVTPVLGYSVTGRYTGRNLPPAFRKLLEKYKEEILYVIANDLQADDEIESNWEKLENGKPLNPLKDAKAVNPLMSTTWNQSPYENEMCPADAAGPGGHCVTGCPATAMAQIMKYWKYPASGTGFHSYNTNYGTLSADFGSTTYDWDAMPNHLNSSNNAVALIMFHCGVAVEMTYGPDGSYGWVIENDNQGSHPVCSQTAYKTYFGYSPNMTGSVRATHSDAEWVQMLKTDLDAGRPIQYAGFGNVGGHTWVCDGYDNAEYFHMNWGWGGSGDGFYEINALNPGTMTFNDNTQALFGIQPSQSTSTSLQMYSAATITPNPIAFGQGFSVNADIINSGSTNFEGDYTAALFNDQGTFIDYIEILTGASLPPNYHYTNGLTFTSSGIAGATPGNYMIGFYSRPTGGGWTLISAGTYTNPINVTVAGTANNIQLYSSITIDHDPILLNQPFTATTDIVNNGSSDFSGDISLDLHSYDGEWIQVIQEYTEVSLQAGYYFEDVTFSTNGLNVDPGTYYLVVWDRTTGGEWEIVSSGSYSNPIEIMVSSQPLSADSYEANNSEANASMLPVSFSGNTANSNTIGSNIHKGTDVDYYKIDLQAGFTYTINARIHDSYNSGNGQSYTGDVTFSYKSGSTWSDAYDDIMPSDILLQNGGTLIFNVTPYFLNATGTYLLDMNIFRNPLGIESSTEKNHLQVFPNPAQDIVTFQVDLKIPGTIMGTLNNVYGQQVMEIVNGTYSAGLNNINIDVSQLAPGYYIYQIKTSAEKATGKLSIVR
jgi:hypothetical protein